MERNQEKSKTEKTWKEWVDNYKSLDPEEKLAHKAKLEEDFIEKGSQAVEFYDTDALSSSRISPEAELDGGVNIDGNDIYIGSGTHVKEGTTVQTAASIGGASFGEKIEVGPNALISMGSNIGMDTNVGSAEIGSGARIGAGNDVEDDVKVGTKATTGEKVHLEAGSRIGDYAYIGHNSKVMAGAEIPFATTVANNSAIPKSYSSRKQFDRDQIRSDVPDLHRGYGEQTIYTNPGTRFTVKVGANNTPTHSHTLY